MTYFIAEVHLVGPAPLNRQAASSGARKPTGKRSKRPGPTSTEMVLLVVKEEDHRG